MRISIELPETLIDEACKMAHRNRMTLSQVIESGLYKILDDFSAAPPFKLRDERFKGDGLSAFAENMSWEEIRQFSYTDRHD
jgi:hypothetical protein